MEPQKPTSTPTAPLLSGALQNLLGSLAMLALVWVYNHFNDTIICTFGQLAVGCLVLAVALTFILRGKR